MEQNNSKEQSRSDKEKDKPRKCVYISHKTHRILTSLVRTLIESGNDNVSVGAFADGIISDFLKERKDKINAIYREDRGDLI